MASVSTPTRSRRMEVLVEAVAELSWAGAERTLTLEASGKLHASTCTNPHIPLLTGRGAPAALLASRRARRSRRLVARCGCWTSPAGQDELGVWEESLAWLSAHEVALSSWSQWRERLEQVEDGETHPFALLDHERSGWRWGLEAVWRADQERVHHHIRGARREVQCRGERGETQILQRMLGWEAGLRLGEALAAGDTERVQLLHSRPTSSQQAMLGCGARALGEELTELGESWIGWVPGQLAAALGGWVIEEELSELEAQIALELLQDERVVRAGHVSRACETARAATSCA